MEAPLRLESCCYIIRFWVILFPFLRLKNLWFIECSEDSFLSHSSEHVSIINRASDTVFFNAQQTLCRRRKALERHTHTHTPNRFHTLVVLQWHSTKVYLIQLATLCRSLSVSNSVTRWLNYFPTFCHLHQRKFAQWRTKYAKGGPTFCQLVNKPSINFPRLWGVCQSVETLPNLVTLVSNHHIVYLRLLFYIYVYASFSMCCLQGYFYPEAFKSLDLTFSLPLPTHHLCTYSRPSLL